MTRLVDEILASRVYDAEQRELIENIGQYWRQRMKFNSQQAWDAQLGLMKKALSVIGPKRRDYSGKMEPFSNFYKSQFFGVEPWRGALIRLSDKLSRMQQLAEKAGQGEVKDESLLDTAADAMNYVFLVLGLILESAPEETAQGLLNELLRWSQADWPSLKEAA